MATGNYDHPSFLTRQDISLVTVTAAASGTSGQRVSGVSNMRFRNAVGQVVVAGTIGTNVLSVIQATGTGILQYVSTGITTSTGLVALGTISYGTAGNTVAVTGTSGDLNTMLPAGSVITVKNGADATGTTQVTLEAYLDPSATWTGPNN